MCGAWLKIMRRMHMIEKLPNSLPSQKIKLYNGCDKNYGKF
jgi:hypothetical protein